MATAAQSAAVLMIHLSINAMRVAAQSARQTQTASRNASAISITLEAPASQAQAAPAATKPKTAIIAMAGMTTAQPDGSAQEPAAKKSRKPRNIETIAAQHRDAYSQSQIQDGLTQATRETSRMAQPAMTACTAQ